MRSSRRHQIRQATRRCAWHFDVRARRTSAWRRSSSSMRPRWRRHSTRAARKWTTTTRHLRRPLPLRDFPRSSRCSGRALLRRGAIPWRASSAGCVPSPCACAALPLSWSPTSAQLIELARLEVARVSTLGIAGFDTPLSGDAMTEAAIALDGVRELFADAGPGFWNSLAPARRLFDASLVRAAVYLRAHPDFDSFNRLAFITEYAAPVTQALDQIRKQASTVPVRIPRAWRASSSSVFDTDAFDVRAYAPTTAPRSSRELIELGRRLFFDVRLSGTGARSCASCHNPATAFQDGLVRASSIRPDAPRVARNTPTLINAALAPAQFVDERSVTLEDQVLEVLRSPAEMASSAEQAAAALSRRLVDARDVRSRVPRRRHRFPPLRVRQSLAAFVRSLVSLDSRFDRAVRPGGDTTLLDDDEKRGFTLFMGKAKCGTCHFAPLFNGTSPPLYMSSDLEVIGTPISPSSPTDVDPDSGRARIDHLPLHLRAFKTPSSAERDADRAVHAQRRVPVTRRGVAVLRPRRRGWRGRADRKPDPCDRLTSPVEHGAAADCGVSWSPDRYGWDRLERCVGKALSPERGPRRAISGAVTCL